MFIFKRFSLSLSLGLLSIMLFSLPLYAEDNKSKNKLSDKAGSTERTKVNKEISNKRKEIVNEAVTALKETKKALTALEKDEQQNALKHLEKAVGELEVALARDPNLAHAAIDTRVTVHDLYASLENIEQARKQAEDYLEDNQIQKARYILGDLASEVIISVISIPLITYPKAIKDAIPLIDAGKTKEAKAALKFAVNTLEVSNYIIPLGIIRAEENLDKAEALAEKKDRTEVENISLTHFLDQARLQLTMAEALGYGRKGDYRILYKHLDKIIQTTEGGTPKSDLFNEIRKFLSEIARPFTDKK